MIKKALEDSQCMSETCMWELHFVTEKILDAVWSLQSLSLRALVFLSLMSLLLGRPHQCLKGCHCLMFQCRGLMSSLPNRYTEIYFQYLICQRQYSGELGLWASFSTPTARRVFSETWNLTQSLGFRFFPPDSQLSLT